jgi:nicotinamidase-related amidase
MIIAGCDFPNCPRTTIYEANERDFRIILSKDATSQLYNKAVNELSNIGVSVMDTSECMHWLGFPDTNDGVLV